MKTLGFIGTGGMGNGMAANLIKAGYSLVVNDLNREQAKGLEPTPTRRGAPGWATCPRSGASTGR